LKTLEVSQKNTLFINAWTAVAEQVRQGEGARVLHKNVLGAALPPPHKMLATLKKLHYFSGWQGNQYEN